MFSGASGGGAVRRSTKPSFAADGESEGGVPFPDAHPAPMMRIMPATANTAFRFIS
jgi:hypothetical protein